MSFGSFVEEVERRINGDPDVASVTLIHDPRCVPTSTDPLALYWCTCLTAQDACVRYRVVMCSKEQAELLFVHSIIFSTAMLRILPSPRKQKYTPANWRWAFDLNGSTEPIASTARQRLADLSFESFSENVSVERKTWTLQEAYQQNKNSINCCVCGKPMDYRAVFTGSIRYCSCVESLKA